MDKFKAISTITKTILDDADLEARFNMDSLGVVQELLPEGFDCSDDELASILEDVKNRVKMWSRNTGVAN